MGYLIVRHTVGSARYVGWMPDTKCLAPEMADWLQHGQTTEILEYFPDRDPLTDTNLIPSLNLWTDHLKEQDNGL